MDFSKLKEFTIPEGKVKSLSINGVKVWEKYDASISYTELEYIESTGTQYIDTGVLATTTTDYEFVGSITEETKTVWIVGAPTWIGIHKKANTVAITQTSSGHTYNNVNLNEVFTIGLFGNKAYFNGVETNTLPRNKSTLTLFLFAYHNSTNTPAMYSYVRMYSFKIWDNGELVRDFIPVLDLNNKPCLFDKVSETLFYNKGTGEFQYELKPTEPELPYSKELEYLESTGTQWIDIGTTVDTSTDEIELCFQLTETAAYKWFFGEYDTDARLGLGSGDGIDKRNFLYKSSVAKISDTDVYNRQHKCLINASGGFIDGVKKIGYASFSSNSTLYLFNLNIDSSSDYKCKAKVWTYKQTRNGVFIRDVIPVLDKNNIPCMYDKVSGELFYNKGTGEFLYKEKDENVEITDLTGTTWHIPSGWTATAGYGDFYLEGSVTDGTNTYDNIYKWYIGYTFDAEAYSFIGKANTTVFEGAIFPKFTSTDSFTLTITGGTDATNTSLISWLQANAVQQKTYDVSGVWKFNDVIDISPTEEITSFNYDVSFISNNNNYTRIKWDARICMSYNNDYAYFALSPDDSIVVGWQNENYKTVDFGEAPQIVPKEIYDWLTVNATKQELCKVTITNRGGYDAVVYYLGGDSICTIPGGSTVEITVPKGSEIAITATGANEPGWWTDSTTGDVTIDRPIGYGYELLTINSDGTIVGWTYDND